MKSLAYTEFKEKEYHYTLPKKFRRVLRVWIDGKILKKKYWRDTACPFWVKQGGQEIATKELDGGHTLRTLRISRDSFE